MQVTNITDSIRKLQLHSSLLRLRDIW